MNHLISHQIHNPIYRLSAFIFALMLTIICLSGCETVDGLTEAEVREGLKEALRIGTDTSVSQANVENGFYGRTLIRILLPPEADPVVNTVKNIPGGQTLIDQLTVKLNRAAEQASSAAKPIFLDAISNITISDAFNILNGADTAATWFLRSNTTPALYTAFKPDIEAALSSVGAQQTWSQIMTMYNAVPFVTPVNVDLADHTTYKGLHGLFYLVGEEEKKIRKDPLHRVTSILQKVFGS